MKILNLIHKFLVKYDGALLFGSWVVITLYIGLYVWV